MVLYVVGIILTLPSMMFLRRIIHHLVSEFKQKDLMPLHFFLGVHVQHTNTCFFLSREHYAEELFVCAAMSYCKPASTPTETKPKVFYADLID